MRESIKCFFCEKEFPDSFSYCPWCGGAIVEKVGNHTEGNRKYGYSMDNKLDDLNKLEISLNHLEQEIDAFLKLVREDV